MSAPDVAVPRNFLFDLDGTLLDSLPGIRHSAESAFRACGLVPSGVELRALIGPPIRTILERMASHKLEAGELDALERAFRWSYDTEGWRMTPHFAGAVEKLSRWKQLGKRLFVVSNKPRHIAAKILEAERTLDVFDEVVTRDSRTPAYRDKLEMLETLLRKWNLDPADCLMVGDTMEDAEAASKTRMRFCLMTHGYGDVPAGSAMPVAFRVDSFAQIPEELLQ